MVNISGQRALAEPHSQREAIKVHCRLSCAKSFSLLLEGRNLSLDLLDQVELMDANVGENSQYRSRGGGLEVS